VRRVLGIFLLGGMIMMMSACAQQGHAAGPPTLTMTGVNFGGTTHFTIKVGQSIVFDDPALGGGPHVLVTGENGLYEEEKGAPDVLNSAVGVNFQAGDKKTYVFTTAGVYHITCTLHSPMNATIQVSA
jgi:plastocyanin